MGFVHEVIKVGILGDVSDPRGTVQDIFVLQSTPSQGAPTQQLQPHGYTLKSEAHVLDTEAQDQVQTEIILCLTLFLAYWWMCSLIFVPYEISLSYYILHMTM